jgi:ubiquinone/menaquinone biosynthesis C-methylase UbiE
MSTLRFSYTLLAPIYDTIVAGATEDWRKKSLPRLQQYQNRHVLINGIGSGLDIPHLPAGPIYTGTDLTPAMLKRAQSRARRTDLAIHLQIADAMALPFENESFDAIVMHLILAVVPEPLKALQEANRVLKPGGRIFIFDKFIQPHERAWLRKIINPVLRHFASRTDVVFEPLHAQCKELELISNQPVLFGGWFRSIELQKRF